MNIKLLLKYSLQQCIINGQLIKQKIGRKSEI